ncbi:MAG: sodium:proton antiporter [Chitinivibrionales bacterium]|nr:sodium:proton antiporter [Chitinivibrionales bacterium]
MTNLSSTLLIWLGIVFWFRGTFPLLSKRSVLYKLHSLSVADTLGSIAVILGLLIKMSREWPLLLLGILSLALWNTMLGYVLANCSQPGGQDE